MRARQVDRSRIVPVIKDRQWIDDTRAQVVKDGAAKLPRHKVETFNDDLMIVYAEDDPTRTRYIPSGEDIGVAEALRRRPPAPSLGGDHLDQGPLRGTAADRGARKTGAHEPFGAAPPLQGGHGDEPDPVPEAAAAAESS